MSCEARTCGGGEVLCAKSTVFLVQAVNRSDPSLPMGLLAGFSTIKGKSVLFSVFGYDNMWPKAISYGTALRTENERFRAAKSIINLMDPKLMFFSAKFFSFHFRDGLQPKMGPHVRLTSAIETGVWIWVSTHRGRQQALRYDDNSSSTKARVYLPSKQQDLCCLLRPATHPVTPQASPRTVGTWLL